jgi:ubiquitin carboxyl-terminal hydrolase 8
MKAMMKHFKEFQHIGLSGLSNLGNTCFINATCQILSHTYELNQFLNQGNYKELLNDCPEATLLKEWDELRNLMYSDNCTIRPAKFVHCVQTTAHKNNNDLFSDFSQNDVPEFFLFVIDCFHRALIRQVKCNNRKISKDNVIQQMCFNLIKHECENGNYSEMIDLFYGIHLSRLQSLDFSKTYSCKAEQFNIINLAIKDENDNSFSTLDECFQFYVKGEVLDGENQWFNEKDNCKMVVQRTICYWSLPQILVIDLKRYNERTQKTRTLIQFPLDGWNLSKYVAGPNASTYIYDLYAVCNHSGLVFGGHYTTSARNANNEWYEFDDGSVTKIMHPIQTVISPKAYCLFYRKR